MDERGQPCLRDEALADVMMSQGDCFYQQAKVAAEATGAAAVQHDGRPEPDSVMVNTFLFMLQTTSLLVTSWQAVWLPAIGCCLTKSHVCCCLWFTGKMLEGFSLP